MNSTAGRKCEKLTLMLRNVVLEMERSEKRPRWEYNVGREVERKGKDEAVKCRERNHELRRDEKVYHKEKPLVKTDLGVKVQDNLSSENHRNKTTG